MTFLAPVKRLAKFLNRHAEEYDDGEWKVVDQRGLRAEDRYEGKFIAQASLEQVRTWATVLKPFVESGVIMAFKYARKENPQGHFLGAGTPLIIYTKLDRKEETKKVLETIGITRMKWTQDSLSPLHWNIKTKMNFRIETNGEFSQLVSRMLVLLDYYLSDAVGSNHFTMEVSEDVKNGRAVAFIFTKELGADAPKGPLIVARLFATIDEHKTITDQPVLRIQSIAPEYHDAIVAAILEKRKFLEKYADVTFSVH